MSEKVVLGPDEMIANAAEIGRIEFGRQVWLNRLAGIRQKPRLPGRAACHIRPDHGRNIWRTIMEGKVTRYSAAAIVALVVAVVLIQPDKRFGDHGVVWAEVVEKVHQMPTAIHREKCVFWEIGQEEPVLEADVILYASEEHGWVEHVFDEKGTLLAQVYFLKETQQLIMVGPTEKKYGKLPLPGDWLERMTGLLTPRGLVDFFTSSHCAELGRAKFDNFDVEGFEISQSTDPNLWPIPEPLRLLFPARDMVARLWIDVETSLAVGFEVQFDTDRGLFTGFEKLHCEFRAYDIQWNAELPEGIFEPNIPEDYTEFTVADFIPAEAKAGLVGLTALPVVGIVAYGRRRRRRSRAARKVPTA